MSFKSDMHSGKQIAEYDIKLNQLYAALDNIRKGEKDEYITLKKGAKDNHHLIPVLKYYTDKFDVYKKKITGLEGIISSIIDPRDIGIIEAEINELKALIPKEYR